MIDINGSWDYKGIIIEGGIITDQSDSYQIKLEYAPYGELTFNGELVGESLGPAGICLPGVFGSSETEAVWLEAGEFYPFRIRFRSGCGTYSDNIKLSWKSSSNPEYSVIGSDNIYLPAD